MRSPYNPSAEDLRLWAYDEKALEPKQDWDIIISGLPYENQFMSFASDSECPKADYFLALLYLIVGDAVRTRYRTKKKEEIEALLEKAKKQFPKHSIYLWTERSTVLLAHPDKFNYVDWCAGSLARNEEQ
jgi:hypothetical protein